MPSSFPVQQSMDVREAPKHHDRSKRSGCSHVDSQLAHTGVNRRTSPRRSPPMGEEPRISSKPARELVLWFLWAILP
jgi:hypothetical protein